ncbi:MAG: ATP-binding protein [Planctomycetaceae bacterium]|nr:ATP-binding protein [Planctomycetaceae bacterium]
MLQNLCLHGFKNFRDARLPLGNLTLLVGTNASGKSNLRDAFRFLHGMSRGYTLAEIIGEKWIEGGTLQWKGIRGGTREATYCGQATFLIEATLSPHVGGGTYKIEVEVGANGKAPRVIRESLWGGATMYFDSHDTDDPPAQEGPQYLFVRLPRDARNRKHGKRLRFVSSQPVLSQITAHDEATAEVRSVAKRVMQALGSMRFLDLAPDAMRIPSLPGQDILGDRGENLSSVLQSICESASTKAAILEWIRELTPLDVTDFEFVSDQTGKILVTLIESGGQKTSAYSASDGTLRFLAMIAAMLGTKPAKFYFFEELENGIHPTRLYLLLQLIEQKVADGKIQVVATSHSPQLLGFLGDKARADAALVYRLENQPDARIRRIVEIPEADRVLRDQDLARLLASGWLEDAVAFSEGAGT